MNMQRGRDGRLRHIIRPVANPGDTHCFMYTIGIADTHPSRVEFITMNVRMQDVNKVGSTYNFLAERLLDGHDVRPYQNVANNHDAHAHDLLPEYTLLPLEGDIRDAILENYATACDEDVNLLLLMPYSALPYTLHTVPPPEVGRDVVVGEKALKIRSIRQKWQRPFPFIRHINGNTLDNHIGNLAPVSQYDAFTHPEWKVDWVCDLEEDEIKFVRENMDLFAEIYKPSSNNA